MKKKEKNFSISELCYQFMRKTLLNAFRELLIIINSINTKTKPIMKNQRT